MHISMVLRGLITLKAIWCGRLWPGFCSIEYIQTLKHEVLSVHRGSYSDALLDAIAKGYKENAVDVARQLLRAMSWFETDLADFDPGTLPAALRRLIVVYRNFLQRGTPSHASTLVEDYLAERWGHIILEYNDTGGFAYAWHGAIPDNLGYLFYMSLFLVDPRVDDRVLSLRVWEGFTGTKMGRKTWERIRGLGEGETWVHAVDPARSELYGGKTITCRAPFDKCDRVEDYRRTWAFFERNLDYSLFHMVM